MAGKKHRQKGDRVERRCLELLARAGLEGRRIPLSGAAGGQFSGDLLIDIPGGQRRIEVKGRKTPPPWRTIKAWLGNNDGLFLVEDYEDPLVVLPWSEYVDLMNGVR